jgi:RHS repeat-associated protein
VDCSTACQVLANVDARPDAGYRSPPKGRDPHGDLAARQVKEVGELNEGATCVAGWDRFVHSELAACADRGHPLPRMSLGFIGQENEDDLGLINLNGRIYDPNLMRFFSADPIISRHHGP